MNVEQARLDVAAALLDVRGSEAFKRRHKRIVSAEGRLRSAQAALKSDEPPPPPPPPAWAPHPLWRKAGGLIVNASSASPELLHRYGIRLVAPQLHAGAGHDPSTVANLAGFKPWAATFAARGIPAGGWGTSLYDPDVEATLAARLIHELGLPFYIADIEAHKADVPGGDLTLTDRFFFTLRHFVGPDYPLGAVGYGVHSSSDVVNYPALRKHNVVYLGDCYDGHARTLGVAASLNRVLQFYGPPDRVKPAFGGKDLERDAAELPHGKMAGLWVWEAENLPGHPDGAQKLLDAIGRGAAEL